MSERFDRYGMLIPTPDMSPAALDRVRLNRIAVARAADAWGLRWWKRQRQAIEEHDPFTPLDVPYPDDNWCRNPYDGSSS